MRGPQLGLKLEDPRKWSGKCTESIASYRGVRLVFYGTPGGSRGVEWRRNILEARINRLQILQLLCRTGTLGWQRGGWGGLANRIM